MQEEAVAIAELDDVMEQRLALDWCAARPGAPLVLAQHDAVEASPFRALRRWPHRDLAGLGAAVDLEQRRAKAQLGRRGERLGQRRGGGNQEVGCGQLPGFVEQRANMDRCRDQEPWPWHGLKTGGDVRGV